MVGTIKTLIMGSRMSTALRMGAREQRRRPLLLFLLAVFPIYLVTRSVAITQATPHQIGLPGGLELVTTMKDLHGAVMAGIAITFAVGLCGVFVMQSAIQGDRRLVIAGFGAGETAIARLLLLAADAVLVVAVSVAATSYFFTPEIWVTYVASAVLLAVIYGALGALFGALLDKLAATYLMLFLVMTDLGIVQNPMFGDGVPGRLSILLPGYGPMRQMVDGAYSSQFHAFGPLALGIGWAVVVVAAVYLKLRRQLGTD